MLLISKESRDNLVTFLNNLVVATVTINDTPPVEELARQIVKDSFDEQVKLNALETIKNNAKKGILPEEAKPELAVQSAPKKRGRKPKISVESQT